MQVIKGPTGGIIKAWIDGVPLEESARKQLDNISQLPFIHKHIAIMPDVHWGMGATIGSVIPTKGAVIPAAVGVDLGCGMMAQCTTLVASDLPDNLFELRSEIEKRIPHGRTDNGGVNDRGAWGEANILPESLKAGLDKIVEKHPKIERAAVRAHHHIGTLGTGNHFVEICLDENDRVWVMLHSGSRGVGNKIGTYFIDLAKQDMRKWFINVPDEDLAYFPQDTEHFSDYMFAVSWAQRYAKANREAMMAACLEAISVTIKKPFSLTEQAVNCHHNYVNEEKHFGASVLVTRKGAVKISPTDLGIIPGSMGARSFIVRAVEGESLRQALCSCSHGAGRVMSRNEAKKRFSVEDHIKSTEGIECRKDIGVIDETPAAYKDIDAVMAAQADHVEVVHTLRQIICVKG